MREGREERGEERTLPQTVPMFSPPHISIFVSYMPMCWNHDLSTANSPPAMAAVLEEAK